MYHSLTRSWTVQVLLLIEKPIPNSFSSERQGTFRPSAVDQQLVSWTTPCMLWRASTGINSSSSKHNIDYNFHRVPINVKALRRQMKAEQVELDDSDEDESEDDGDEDEEAQLTMSVEISCSLWALDLLKWQWTRYFRCFQENLFIEIMM